MDAKGTKFRKLSTMNKKQMRNPKVQLEVAAMHEVPLYKSPDYIDAEMKESQNGAKRPRDEAHNKPLELASVLAVSQHPPAFIPESTLSQQPPAQPIDLSKNKSKSIIVAKSLHPTDFCGYTIRERFAKMGWEQLLDFDCDKIYRRIVIDWTASLSRKGDELTGTVDGKPFTISPTIIRDLLKVDTRTDLPYARFNQADFQTITDENEIRWLEACKTVFGRELDKNVVISCLEMTPLVKILWGIGLWTFHPRLNDTNCVLAREIYLLHALYTGEYLYSFAHLMIDDIWSMYEDEYQQTIPHVYYLSEILTRLGAVSHDERIEVVDVSHRQITRSSFRDLRFSESPTRYILYDRVLKQNVTFLKKAKEVEAPPQSLPHLMPIPNPHADKTNNPKGLINTQLSQSQKQLEDMMSIVSNMQKHMEQQAFEAKRRDQARELLEQKRETRAQEREKQVEEREKQAEIQAHTMTNNLLNLINKQSEEHEKMIMIVKNMQKQMGDQASKAESREQAREKREKERETQVVVKAHAMVDNLQNLISNQFEEQHDKMLVIVNNKEKQIGYQALEGERRELARQKWEEEREKQAEIKAQAMTNNLQNLINKQSEEHEKMIMIVKNMQKQMGDQASKAERREQAQEKREEERETQAEVKAHAMESNLQNLISKQFQEQHEKMTMIVNDKLKQMECQALKAEIRKEEQEKEEQKREEQEQIKAHAMACNLQNMISKQLQEQHEKMMMIVNNMQKQKEKQEEEREKRAEIRAHAIIWDIERQRYLYEQEQRQLRMAWNQGNCVNAVDDFQFPQISHTSFHPPRVGSRYYDPTQSNEIPQAFGSLYHDIYGPID